MTPTRFTSPAAEATRGIAATRIPAAKAWMLRRRIIESLLPQGTRGGLARPSTIHDASPRSTYDESCEAGATALAMRQGAKESVFSGRTLKHFSGVVESIYAASFNADLWPAAIEGIADLHKCPIGLLITPATAPRSGGFIFPHGLSQANLELWATKYVEHDPWVPAAIGKDMYRDGLVMVSDELLPRTQLEASIFYKEFLRPQKFVDFCTGVVFGPASGSIPSNCSLLRANRGALFTAEDKQLMGLTINHPSRALGAMYRLRDAELRVAASRAALNRIASGVLLFGERGNVVYANDSALSLLKNGGGVTLRTGGPQDELGWLA